MFQNSFEITIPVYNEETSLESKIITLHDFCINHFSGKLWAIIIADNGSMDRTQVIAEDLAATYNQIKYVKLDRKGVGLALKTSWKQSNSYIIGSMDLDLSTDLKHLPQVLSAITEQDYDLVYGTRLHSDSRVIGRTLKREIISRIFNYILQNYLKVSISDSMSGFTFFKRSFLDKILKNGAESDKWFFQAEILIVSEWLGLRMYELPIHWIDDSDSKVKVLSLMIEYLGAMRTLHKKRQAIIK